MRFLQKLKSYPWLVIFFSALFLFYKYVLQVSPSVIANNLMRHFHLNGAELGNLAATFFYAYLVVQLFAGPLLDKLSARLITALAILLCGLGDIWFSHAPSLMQAMFARILIGAGAAFATVSYIKMASVWFNARQFAFVSGLLATAAMIGSMCGQVPFALLVVHFGWQSSLKYCGVFGVALAVLFYILVRNKPSDLAETKHIVHIPQLSHFSIRDSLSILKSKFNWCLMLYGGLAFTPIAVFGGLWGDSFLQTAFHATKPAAAMLVSFSFFGLAIGAPILGYISDRTGKRFVIMLLGLLLSIAAISVALYLPNAPRWLEALALFLFGFGEGAYMLVFVAGKEINSPGMTATMVAFINTGDALIGTFTEPLIGKFLDIEGHHKMHHGILYFNLHDYRLALLLLPFYLFSALICLCLAKRVIK